MRVGLPHFGQSVLFEVSITFLRSAVFAILAILSPGIREIAHTNPLSSYALQSVHGSWLLIQVAWASGDQDAEFLSHVSLSILQDLASNIPAGRFSVAKRTGPPR